MMTTKRAWADDSELAPLPLHRHKYVPSELLQAWGFSVETAVLAEHSPKKDYSLRLRPSARPEIAHELRNDIGVNSKRHRSYAYLNSCDGAGLLHLWHIPPHHSDSTVSVRLGRCVALSLCDCSTTPQCALVRCCWTAPSRLVAGTGIPRIDARFARNLFGQGHTNRALSLGDARQCDIGDHQLCMGSSFLLGLESPEGQSRDRRGPP